MLGPVGAKRHLRDTCLFSGLGLEGLTRTSNLRMWYQNRRRLLCTRRLRSGRFLKRAIMQSTNLSLDRSLASACPAYRSRRRSCFFRA